MELAGRLRQTLIQEHFTMSPFHRNARPSAAILFVIWLVQLSSSRAAETKIWEEFSGQKAFAQVQRLVDFGARPAGSDALEKSRHYIEEQLRHSGWKVTRQTFNDNTPRGKIQFVNLIAEFFDENNAASPQGEAISRSATPAGKPPLRSSSPSFLLCSHYDTKTFDAIRFVGANDGGSSTGLLIEMARGLAINPAFAAKGELGFFDGEEAFENFTATDGLYGSRHFASELRELAKNFRGGILFDMIGDKSLQVTLSPDSPADLARNIFAGADALGQRAHFTYFGGGITD